jgi:hypothetical protein
MLGRKNSLNILIGELEPEIAEYVGVAAPRGNRLKSGQVTQSMMTNSIEVFKLILN